MSSVEFDVDLLIGVIAEKPEVWDISNEAYKDKNKKKEAWIDICRILIPNFDHLQDIEQSDISQKLIVKWKCLKDAYVRSIREELKGNGSKKRKMYVYGDQLSFLYKQLLEKKATVSIADDDKVKVAKTSDEKSVQEQKRIQQSIASIENKDCNCSKSLSREKDEDAAFFKSVLGTVQQFDEDQKLDFRSCVLNLMQDIRKRRVSVRRLGPGKNSIYFLDNPLTFPSSYNNPIGTPLISNINFEDTDSDTIDT